MKKNDHIVEAGDLRFPLDLQSKPVNTDTDEGGGTPGAFTTFDTVWGNVVDASAYEVTAAAQKMNQISHIVTIRWYEGFKTEWRIIHDGVVLDVVGSVDKNSRKRLMRIQCIERKGKNTRG